MTKPIVVLSTILRLSQFLRQRLPQLEFVNVTPGGENATYLREAEIVVADFNLLIPYVDQLPRTEWVQGTWAGADKLIPHLQGKNLTYTISRFTGTNFGQAMSEYVLAQIVNHERNQQQQYENQKNRFWSQEGRIMEHRLISDLKIGILGVGIIGKHIAKVLKAFGATIWGLSRTIHGEKPEYIDQHRTTDNLTEVLQNCDYIVNVLPSTNDTRNILGGDVLANCQARKAVFINVGRGTVIAEKDLIRALDERWISAAILDVFENEPLPKSSRLWTMPQVLVTITPHVAGVTRAQDVAEVFARNFAKYSNGEKIENTLDLQRGY